MNDPIEMPARAHACARQECTEPVRMWADQMVMDVVSTAGTHRFHYHVECWQQEGGRVEPQPGVAIHVRRPTLHPTMRHRRDVDMGASMVELQAEIATVTSLQARGAVVVTP